jgi:hypothetical protein
MEIILKSINYSLDYAFSNTKDLFIFKNSRKYSFYISYNTIVVQLEFKEHKA